MNANFERETLIRLFGFKGGYVTEIWQTMALLESAKGTRKVGLCTQNVLLSDARVFADHSESGGNALMIALTERALQLAVGRSFQTPVDLLDDLLDEVYEYEKAITGHADLRKTFALNALVGLDNAAWLLYAQENDITNFDDLIPEAYKPSLALPPQAGGQYSTDGVLHSDRGNHGGRGPGILFHEDQDRTARDPAGDAGKGHGPSFGHS